jgi:hypothetical protein
MRFLVIPFLLSVLMAAVPAQAQEDTKFLSPSEAYKAALLPLNAARAQQNDLTEADIRVNMTSEFGRQNQVGGIAVTLW